MNKISSRDNARLKHVRKVRDGKAVTEIFVEGLRLTEEALCSRADIKEVFVSSTFGSVRREAELRHKLETRDIELYEVNDNIFQSVADTKKSQGVILICGRPDTSQIHFSQAFSKRFTSLTLFLNRINNPANLGAILRTAEAANVAGVIISNNSADVFSPKALRSSMGSGLRLNVWENATFDNSIEWARDAGLRITGADIGADKFYTDVDWNLPRLLIFGSEAEGLTSDELAQIDEQIKIPMDNDVESLNLAVSSGIILYEAKRQQGI